MKARIHNANVDVEIEGETPWVIMEEFQRDYPSEAHNMIKIEWDEEARAAIKEAMS